MYFKEVENVIVCTRDGDTTLFTPDKNKYVEDETIPWKNSDREIIRLSDYSFVFIDDPQVFQMQKTIRLTILEKMFDERVSGEFICSLGWPMQFDRSDTLAVEGAIQLMRANGQCAGYLTDANDTTHYDLPLATIETVKLEMLAAYAACHARKQELRAAINAAQTVEALNAIEITWPV